MSNPYEEEAGYYADIEDEFKAARTPEEFVKMVAEMDQEFNEWDGINKFIIVREAAQRLMGVVHGK